MGAVTGMLGMGSGAGGTGFDGPQQVNIANPVTAGQISQNYADTQSSMQSQQDLLAAIQGQKGLQNQSNVYNQTMGVANGTGPNPAQAMLNQATGQNVANQAALMAGQRGASGNVGLMARQAAQQGANTQQQAVGQGATMQANQSLNALNSAGTMANQMATNQIGQTNANTQAQQSEQNALLNAQSSYNQSQVSGQASVNAANAAMANTRLGQQGSAIGGIFGGGAAASGLMKAHGGEVHKYADGGDVNAYPGQSQFGAFLHGLTQSSPQPMAQQVDEAGQPAQQQKDPLQSGMSDFSNALVKGVKGSPATPMTDAGYQMPALGGSSVAPAAAAPATAAELTMPEIGASAAGTGGGLAGLLETLGPAAAALSKGGAVPAVVSPGEKYLAPQDVQAVKRGANPMRVGETIPGKPAVGGAKDSYKNDVVPKTLQEGGIVVPRSKTQSKNPEKASADFVHSILAKRVAKGKR